LLHKETTKANFPSTFLLDAWQEALLEAKPLKLLIF
jgi:hypothetical protein